MRFKYIEYVNHDYTGYIFIVFCGELVYNIDAKDGRST